MAAILKCNKLIWQGTLPQAYWIASVIERRGGGGKRGKIMILLVLGTSVLQQYFRLM